MRHARYDAGAFDPPVIGCHAPGRSTDAGALGYSRLYPVAIVMVANAFGIATPGLR